MRSSQWNQAQKCLNVSSIRMSVCFRTLKEIMSRRQMTCSRSYFLWAFKKCCVLINSTPVRYYWSDRMAYHCQFQTLFVVAVIVLKYEWTQCRPVHVSSWSISERPENIQVEYSKIEVLKYFMWFAWGYKYQYGHCLLRLIFEWLWNKTVCVDRVFWML
jgi:hypothetical protein